MTVYYGSSIADGTLTTACVLAPNSGGVETSKVTTNNGLSGNFMEVTSQGLSNVPCRTSIPAPTGNGWIVRPGSGNFATGNWSASITLANSVNSGVWTLRFYQRSSGGTYTSIGSITTNISATAKTTYSFANTSMASVQFASTDGVYVDLWYQDTSGASGDTVTIYESTTSTNGVASDVQITTSVFTPGATVKGFTPFYMRRSTFDVLHFPLTQINIPRYVVRGFMSTLLTYTLNIPTRFNLGSLKDTSTRLRLMSANQFKDVATRFKLARVKDIATRFILANTGSAVKDIATRFRLAKLNDIASRFRLGSLKDISTRLRLMSANQLKDIATRFKLSKFVDIQTRVRLGRLKDTATRFLLSKFVDIQTRFRLASLKDIATRFRIMQPVVKDVSTRYQLASLRDVPGRFRLARVKDIAIRLILVSATLRQKDISTRLRIMSALNPRDMTSRIRLGRLWDVASRFKVALLKDLSTRIRLCSSFILRDLSSRFRIMQGTSRDLSSRLLLVNQATLSKTFTATEVVNSRLLAYQGTIARLNSINLSQSRLFSTSFQTQFSMALLQIPRLQAVHIVMASTPNTSIQSTITVTDNTGALVSNLSGCTTVVKFPDGTTTNLSLGSGITNIGNGQYQARYNTKGVGIDVENWSVTAADGVTIGNFQFEIGVNY